MIIRLVVYVIIPTVLIRGRQCRPLCQSNRSVVVFEFLEDGPCISMTGRTLEAASSSRDPDSVAIIA